jgi:regulator of protease activity HflC (stomatin/prohibitin superfamily)
MSAALERPRDELLPQAAPAAPDGPLVQSVSIAFVALRVFTVLLALGWLTANVRPIPPGTQAVVLRFGRVVSVQQSGLLWAWPRPIETVVRLPSAERQMVLKLAVRTARVAGILDDFTRPEDVPQDAGVFMTGDGGIVLLDAAITWRIADAAAYFLARDHVAPALRRVFEASAVRVAATRQLDDFLAVRPERAADPAAEAARNAVRGDIVAAMNQRLQALTLDGAGLGVEVTRADLTALLPPSAKSSFDAVLDATQRAEQGLATARTDATRIRQRSDRQRDSILTTAHAAAEERLDQARASTAAVTALAAQSNPAARPSLLDQVYRDRIGIILGQAASVSAIDARGVSRLILPGVP